MTAAAPGERIVSGPLAITLEAIVIATALQLGYLGGTATCLVIERVRTARRGTTLPRAFTHFLR